MIHRKYLFIFIVFFLFSNPVKCLGNDKISYIDIEFLINNSNLGKQILKTFNDLKTKNLEDLSRKESDLKKQNEEIVKIKNVISEEELEKKIKILKLEIKEFNIHKEKISLETNKLRNKEIENFFNKINPLIQKYMDENSIDIIIDKKNIFIARSEYDITKDILDLINKNF